MFDGALPAHVNTTSLRVSGGLGTIAKIVGDGSEIYRQKLSFDDASRRIETLYKPYHARLGGLLKHAYEAHRCAVLIDCHSMPSIGGVLDQDAGADRPEIVLGDRYGTSCAPILMHTAEQTLRGLGYKVARNNPYAGGFNTEQYGRPAHGRHALQIELNRNLYMNETSVERSEGLAKVKKHMTELIAALSEIDHRYLKVAPSERQDRQADRRPKNLHLKEKKGLRPQCGSSPSLGRKRPGRAQRPCPSGQ